MTTTTATKHVKCQHEWHYDEDGYVEQCVPAICILCGQKGCAHDVGDRLWLDSKFKRKFFEERGKMEEKRVNPLETNSWTTMKYAGCVYNRHENHISVNHDGTVSWKEYSVEYDQHNVEWIQNALQASIKTLVSSNMAANVSGNIVAEEALETLVSCLSATPRTAVYEKHAVINECVFVQGPLDQSSVSIRPGFRFA